MAEVEFVDATRRYPGNNDAAVEGLSLLVPDGELVVFVGPSGSGKSTSLRMVAGLEPVDEGAVLIGGRDVAQVSPKDRDIAMVFQNYALYPHMTVRQNLGFALRVAGLPKPQIAERVESVARQLEIDEFLGRKPRHLSGGQRQRVAMGRAIVREPAVFLMDEPLSNLDAKLRVQTRTQIATLQRRLATTTIYVTHDQVEAMTLGDRVAVMHEGKLQQLDTPRGLYDRPANVFVAGFMGSPPMNLIDCVVDGGDAVMGEWRLPLPRGLKPEPTANGKQATIVGVRPESWEITTPDTGLVITVDVVEELGSDAFLHGTYGESGETLGLDQRQVVARVDPRHPPQKGERVGLRVDPQDVHLFSRLSGERQSQELSIQH